MYNIYIYIIYVYIFMYIDIFIYFYIVVLIKYDNCGILNKRVMITYDVLL